jgi:hypothetical protein
MPLPFHPPVGLDAISDCATPKNLELFAKPPLMMAVCPFTPSLVKCQLGVNNELAITRGTLANKPQFFGIARAEVTSSAAQLGNWHGDDAGAQTSVYPWLNFDAPANQGARPGVFSADQNTGGVVESVSHRTILSGY